MKTIYCLAMLLLFASATQTGNDDKRFGTVFSDGDYRELVDKAKSEDKTLLVLVGANWCHFCVEMKRDIEKWRDRELKDVVIAMVDTDDSEMKPVVQHILKGKGSGIPQLSVYHYRDGWRRVHAEGKQSRADLFRMIKQVER